MKTAPSFAPPRAAFTLVELLVVISIIVILAGLLFPVMSSVQERAKKLQATNDEQGIVNAVKSYYTEYGRLPVTDVQAAANSDAVYSNPGGSALYNDQLLNILLGKMHDSSGKYLASSPSSPASPFPYNTRQVVFLEAKLAKDANSPKNGLSTKGGEENRWYDPWGKAYCVWLDANYDNVINDVFGVYVTDVNNPLPPVQVAVASFGKDLTPGDRAKGDKKYRGSDDVVSWR